MIHCLFKNVVFFTGMTFIFTLSAMELPKGAAQKPSYEEAAQALLTSIASAKQHLIRQIHRPWLGAVLSKQKLKLYPI